MTPNSKQCPIDEVDRVVVKLETTSPFLWTRCYVAIAFDRAGRDNAQPVLIAQSSRGLPFLAQYSTFNVLCDDRAQRCVDGQLRVHGKTVRPEHYLALWRAAIAQSIPIAELPTRYGLRLYGVLGGPLRSLRGMESSRTDSPFATFDEFESHYAAQFSVGPSKEFTLTVDLAEPDAVRNLYFGDSFLRKLGNDSRTIARVEPRLVGYPVPVQAAMFAATEAAHVVSN